MSDELSLAQKLQAGEDGLRKLQRTVEGWHLAEVIAAVSQAGSFAQAASEAQVRCEQARADENAARGSLAEALRQVDQARGAAERILSEAREQASSMQQAAERDARDKAQAAVAQAGETIRKAIEEAARVRVAAVDAAAAAKQEAASARAELKRVQDETQAKRQELAELEGRLAAAQEAAAQVLRRPIAG